MTEPAANWTLDQYRRAFAQVSLKGFVRYTFRDYRMGWVHEEICKTLDNFLDDVEARKSPRLIICLPPRSGKSELISRRFPAYALGRYPDKSIIAASYSADLATRFSRDVQRIIDSDSYRAVFPGTQLAGGNTRASASGTFIRTADLFEIVGHSGSYRATGVGGGVTGMGCDALLLDDLIKDRASANSQTIRDALWDWYTSTAYTRLSPGGGVIVMCTRWHLDDIVGRLIEHDRDGTGDHWTVINYPAIAEQDEPHRKAGEALHPARYPLEQLLAIKRTIGSRDWQALYQQAPLPEGGGLFKRAWIRYWGALPARFDAIVSSWDMSFKGGNSSDFVVGQIWGKSGADYYLVDQVRGQWSFVQTKDAFLRLHQTHPKAIRKLIEDKANGPAIIDSLRRTVSGLVPVTPRESKEARASAVSALWEAGNVYLPPPSRFPWVKDVFEPELLSFPAAAHDDQVDAMTQALSDLVQRGGWKMDKSNLAALSRR